jgi:hypothetical protein
MSTIENLTENHKASPRWPLERALFALAGTVTLLSAALGAFASKWFLLLAAFVGVSEWLYVTVGACPASIVLRRTCGLRSAIYPDQAPPPADIAADAARDEVMV